MHALALALVLALAAPSTGARAPAPDPLERRREEIARELVAVAADLQREVLAGDVDEILARVPEEGLRCAGQLVPRAKVAHDLRSPTSWVHGALFGGPGYRAPQGAPASLAAFLRAQREIAVVVSFERGGAGPEGLPCLDFRAKGVLTPGVPFCFEKRGGRWWLTESLYPCG